MKSKSTARKAFSILLSLTMMFNMLPAEALAEALAQAQGGQDKSAQVATDPQQSAPQSAGEGESGAGSNSNTGTGTNTNAGTDPAASSDQQGQTGTGQASQDQSSTGQGQTDDAQQQTGESQQPNASQQPADSGQGQDQSSSDGAPSSNDASSNGTSSDPATSAADAATDAANQSGASVHKENDLYEVMVFGASAKNATTAAAAIDANSKQVSAAEAREMANGMVAAEASSGEENDGNYPRRADGSDIESISIKWITKDTEENNDDNLLYLVPGDDAAFSVRFQVDYALSGEHNYNPGDIQIRIPAQVFHKRSANTASDDGGLTGTMVIPLAESPSARTDFNWTRVGNEYVITNTKSIVAATKGFIQFEIKDLMPHSIVDMSFTDNLQATIEVTTHLNNIIGLKSNKINAQVNTAQRVTRANKDVSPGSPTIVSASEVGEVPAWIASKYPGEENYVLVNWHMNSYHTGNQPYTLDALDQKTDGYDGFIVAGTQNTATASSRQIDKVQNGWYTPGTSSYSNVKTAYPLSQFEKDTTYTFTNKVTYTLTPIDKIDAPTQAVANARVPFSYSDPKWVEPTGHFNVFKWGNDNDPGVRSDDEWTTHKGTSAGGDIPTPNLQHLNGWYGMYRKALNELREGNDTEIAYTIKSEGYLLPWIWDGSLSDDPPATKVAENYGKRPVTMITADTGLWTGGQTTRTFDLVPEEDIDFVRLNFVKPSIGKIKKINVNDDGSFSAKYAGDGTFEYQPDYDDSKIPPIVLEVQRNGAWEKYATANWTSGSCVITLEDGTVINGDTVDFPPNTENFRTSVTSGNAYIYYYVRPTVEIHPTTKWITLIESMFEQTNTPSTEVWNGVNMIANDYDGKQIVDISKNGYDKLDGYTTDIKSIPYKSGTVKNIDYAEREVTLHYRARVEERSVIGDRDVYTEALEDGIIEPETEGTWYDLLPVGLNPIMGTVTPVRANDSIKDAYAIANYKNTGRTLLVVEVKLAPTPQIYTENQVTYYEDVPQIEFDAECDISYIIDHGTKTQKQNGEVVFGTDLHNVIVFESGNDTLGSVEGYRGETNDPEGTNNVRTREAFYRDQDGYIDSDALSALANLDNGRSTESFLYAGAFNHVEILNTGYASILKEVSVNNDGYWSTGIYYNSREEDARDVYEGGMYSYRIVALSGENTRTRNMVIYDSLENVVPQDGNHPEDVDAVAAGKRWRGTLRSVDVSPLRAKGIDAVVYYSTVPELKMQDVDDPNGGHPFEDDINLANTSIWTKASDYTGDLADVHAVAIDIRRLQNGEEFFLEPQEVVSAYINMWAPTGEEADRYIQGDYHAYNNIFLSGNVVDARTGGEGERQFIRQDYVKVGLIENNITINKVWNDDNDRDGKRTGALTFTLLQDGKEYSDANNPNPRGGHVENPVTVEADAQGNISHTFKYLPYCDDEGNVFTYSIRETEPEGYQSTVTRSQDGHTFTITNTHEPEKTSVSGTKTWVGDTSDVRPESIRIDLYADGVFDRSQRITPDGLGNWPYSFENLNKYRDGGIEIEYTVQESAVRAGSLDAYVGEVDGYNITNTYHPYGDVKLTKSISGATNRTATDTFPFTFQILDSEDSPLFDEFAYEITDASGSVKSSGTVKCDDVIRLGDGQTIHIKELPQGARVVATETVGDGYTALGGESRTLTVKANDVRQTTVTNIYKTEGFVNLGATKVLTGREMKNYQFRFELATDEGFQNIVQTASSRADGSVTFGALYYRNEDAGQTHTYYLHEVNAGRAGYTYDSAVYRVDVAVVDNGDGTITATPTYYQKSVAGIWARMAAPLSPSFNNEYHAEGDLEFKAWKVLSQRDLVANEFEFELLDSNGTVVETAKNAADGTITFPKIHFTEVDAGKEYDYTLREKKGTDRTVNYSKEEYAIHVVVADNGDGTLSFAQDVSELELVEDTNADKLIWGRGGIENIIAQAWMADGQYLMNPRSGGVEYDGMSLDPDKTYTCGNAAYTGHEIIDYLMETVTPQVVTGQNSFYWSESYATPTNYRNAMPDGLSYGQRAGSGFFAYQAYPLIRVKSDEPATPVFTNTLKDGSLAIQKRVEDGTYGEFTFKVKLTGENVPEDGNYSFVKSQVTSQIPITGAVASIASTLSDAWDWLVDNVYHLFVPRVAYAETSAEAAARGVFHASASMLQGEAYGVYDSANETLMLFRDTPGKYRNGQADGTKTYYTGVEEANATSFSVNNSFFWGVGRAKTIIVDDGVAYKPLGRIDFSGGSNNHNATQVLDLSRIDTSLVTSIVLGCDDYRLKGSGYNQITGLENLDTSNMEQIVCMAYNGSKGRFLGDATGSLDLRNWRGDSLLTMNGMFDRQNLIKSLNLSGLQTPKVTDMSSAFSNMTALEKLDISALDVSSVSNMNNMFGETYNSTRNLKEVKLGVNFSFKGNGIETSSKWTILPTPSGSQYTGKWTCIERPEYSLTPAELRDQYNGPTMYGTWVWEEKSYTINYAAEEDGSNIFVIERCALDSVGDYALRLYDYDGRVMFGWKLVSPTAPPFNGYLTQTSAAGTKLANIKNSSSQSLSDAISSSTTLEYTFAPVFSTTYNVDFKPGTGGAGSMASITDQPADQALSLPASTFYRFNYHVKEWSGSDGKTYADGATIPANSVMPGSTLTLTAVWEPDNNSVNMNNGEFEVTLKSNERATFSNIPAGTAYEVYELTPAGWTLVSSSNTAGSIQPLVTSTASFTNQYTPSQTSIQLVAHKNLDGEPAKNGAFTFTLRQGSATGTVLQTKTNVTGGGVVFDPITYSTTGTYTYYISEVAGNDGTINYDTHTETVTVRVTREDGKLKATATYDSDGATFNNTTKQGKLTLKKTLESGDANEEFTFTVLFQNASDAYNYTGSKSGTIASGGTISLKGGESVTINNLPAGTIYSITESIAEDSGSVLKSSTGASGTIAANATSVAEFVNTTPSINPQSTNAGINLQVRKALENSTLKAGQFEFQLLDASNRVLGTAYNDANGKVSFNMLEYETEGTHNYTVREVVPTGSERDANVTYDTSAKNIAVTVASDSSGKLVATADYYTNGEVDEAKVPTFTNTHRTGKLLVSKKVEGATAAAANKEFTFTVTLASADGDALTAEYPYTTQDASGADVATGTVTSGGTIKLKGGQAVLITGIPVGASYMVEEAEVAGFELTNSTGLQGTIGTAPSTAILTNTYTSYGQVPVVAQKALTGRTLRAGQFDFELVDENDTVVGRASNAADGTIAFSPLSFTQDDDGKTFTYTVVEEDAGDAGYTYVTDPLTVTVAVTDNGDGTLSFDVQYDGGNNTLTNKYTASGEAVLQATKQLTGRNLNNEQFSFEVRDSANKVVATGKNDATGKVVFSAIRYTEADAGNTYTYTMREVRPSPVPAGYTYDGHTETVTVAVADDGNGDRGNGVLSTTVTYDADGAVFSNTYNPTPAEATVKAQKEISGRAARATDSFTFRLTAEGNAPLRTQDGEPAAGYLEQTARSGSAASVNFQNLVFTRDDLKNANGTYATHKDFVYRVHEVCLVGGADRNPAAGGYQYRGFTYAADQTVTIRLADDGSGRLRVTYKDPAAANRWLSDSMERLVFVNTYQVQPTQGQLSVRKRIVDLDHQNIEGWKTGSRETNRHDWSDLAFQAELHSVDGAPMPADAVDGVKTVSIASGGAYEDYGLAAFGSITYTTWGEWDYVIKEVLPAGVSVVHPVNEDQELTYDISEHQVHVVVADNGDGTLANPVVTYRGVQDGEHNPTILTNAETGDDEVVLRAHKALTGEALHEGQFEFELYEADESYHVAGDAEPLATATNDEDGYVSGVTQEFTVRDIKEHPADRTPHTHTFYYVGREVANPDDEATDGITYESKDVRYAVTITEKIVQLGHPEHNHVYVSKIEVGDSETSDMTTVFELPYDANRTVDQAKAALEAAYNDIEWPTYNNAFEANGSAQFSLVKHIEGDRQHWWDDDAFTFELTALPDEHGQLAPLRTAEGAQPKLTVVATSNEPVSFSELLFNQDDLKTAGLYVHSKEFTYQVSEVLSAKGGFTLASPQTVTITVTNDHTNTLKTTYGSQQTTTFAPLQFANQYDINDSQEAVLRGSKQLTGRAWHENDTFILRLTRGANTADREISTPMPEGSVEESGEESGEVVACYKDVTITSASTNADWEDAPPATKWAEFGTITYTRPGTYYYTLSEVVPSEDDQLPGVTYDTNTYTVTVVVEDNGDGTLTKPVVHYALEPDSGEEVTDGDADEDANSGDAADAADDATSSDDASQGADGASADDATDGDADSQDGNDASGDDAASEPATAADPTPFNNVYLPEATQVQFEAQKTMDGRELVAGRYSFEAYLANEDFEVLSDQPEGYPLVATANPTEEGGSVGTATFPAIVYDQTGVQTYHYVIREVVPSTATNNTLEGVAFDTHDTQVTVQVTDFTTEGVPTGELVATVAYNNQSALTNADKQLTNKAAFTNTYAPEELAIEKYVNKDVHANISWNDTITYDILAYVTKDANSVTVRDTLVPALEYVSAANDVLVKSHESVDHKPKGTVSKAGADVKGAKVSISGQDLVVSIADATALRGQWIHVTFRARIRSSFRSASKVKTGQNWTSVKSNDPILSTTTHEGILNNASYVVTANGFDQEQSTGQKTSNTVTITPQDAKSTKKAGKTAKTGDATFAPWLLAIAAATLVVLGLAARRRRLHVR